MKNKKTIRIILSVGLIISFTALVSAGIKNGGNSKTNEVNSAASTGKVGNAYRMNINKINLPFDNKGIIAAVNIPDPIPEVSGVGGKFAGDVFLYSSGFFLSGYAYGNWFANAVASSSYIEDYVPGTVESGPSDPRAQIYVVKDDDVPFSQSWIDWQDAVALGADFYDGNNDGEYVPVDLNSNSKWDSDEDRPDLLGDETAWCVYNDGKATNERRWTTQSPFGIEVRQTVFSFAAAGTAGNIIFVRYRFKYVGLGETMEVDRLDSVYFGVWADPDLGSPDDDLIACDVSRNAGITYNDGPDPNAAYGNMPPAFFMDFLSGPVTYIPGETYTDINSDNKYNDGIDVPLDTAYQRLGDVKGIKTFPGAKNLEMSSFVQYINGDVNLSDPENAIEARNFCLGYDSKGHSIDPCSFSYGEVKTVNCNTIDPRFWYSGDPVTQQGWINTVAADARQMTNIGPFALEKGIEQEVFVAYVVGQGDNALSSIEKARVADDTAQQLFNKNFPGSDVTAVKNENKTYPSEYSIKQNYPNPFNPTTAVEYSLPQESNVKVCIYNSLGEIVAELVNGTKPAGNYHVNYNAASLASGIYFCTIRANSTDGKETYWDIKKMMLLK